MAIDNVILQSASFRGTPFYYQSSSVTGGRKTVTHEYPNSSNRVVEDLGLLLSTYNIEAIIDTNAGTSTRTSFIEKLEKPGIGTLVHPLYGTKNVVVKGFTVNDNINELGIVRFSITFEQANRPLFPADLVGNLNRINELRSQVLQAQQAVGFALFAINKQKAAFNAAVNKVNAISDTLRVISSGVVGSADTLADFSTAVLVLQQEVERLIQSPDELFLRVDNAINLLTDSFDLAGDAFDTMKNLFDFSAGNDTVTGESPNVQQRRDNEKSLNDQVNVNALSANYQNAANTDFETVDQLSEFRNALETEYERQIGGLDPSVAEIMNQLRIETNIYLDNLSVNLASLATITTPPISLNVLTYSIYGGLDNKETLRRLNQYTDTSRVSGEVRIITTG